MGRAKCGRSPIEPSMPAAEWWTATRPRPRWRSRPRRWSRSEPFDPTTSEIVLTGDQSAAAVAEWLEAPRLDPSELRPGLEHPLTVRKLAEPEINVVVNGGLALALITRSGLRREEGEWVSPDGRRTSAIAEAVLWALLRIATRAN
jgi:hypothetical protein